MVPTTTWLERIFPIFEAENDRLDQNWNVKGGLYVFAEWETDGQGSGSWRALYVGACDSLEVRLPNHERWREAAALGGTHVHISVEEDESCREQIEREMIRAYDPPLNTQHKG